MLKDWNFSDEAANSTLPQVNRQKSARNLDVLQFDASEPCAVFFDQQRKERHTTTLTKCDCKDFNFAGSAPRKSFKPCMHIYRLAIELGLIEAKYLDHQARFALARTLSRQENQRLQHLSRDQNQWGGWSIEIHASGIQKNRQYRAYDIIHSQDNSIQAGNNEWTIHSYKVTFASCECMDFFDRRLPCKHIYAAAIVSKIALPFTRDEYVTAKSKGMEIVFEFPVNG
jgi:hypothetical protein